MGTPDGTVSSLLRAELARLASWVSESFLNEDAGWSPVSARVAKGKETTVTDEWTEEDLAAARADSCQLFDSNEFAIGATDSRRNYAVGDGLAYKAGSADEKSPASDNLLSDLQAFLDLFVEVNGLSDVESETVLRVDRDGDAAVRLFPGDDGVARVRFVEASAVRSPDENKATAAEGPIRFGVETNKEDSTRVLAYWIDYGEGPERVPESEVVLVRPVGDSSIPRGVPIYWPVADNLRRCEDLLYAMSATAKLRTKIAMVLQMANISRAVEDDLRARLTSGVQVDARGQQTPVSVEQMPFGAILRVPSGTEVTMPPHGLDAAGSVEILQAELRAVAVRLNMPEWMFSGLADAKYSNALVVEAPALKSFLALQRMLTTAFGRGRYGQRASVAWRAVRLAVAAGLLPQEALTKCVVTCTAPTIVVRDRASEASTHATLTQSGIESIETAQLAIGLDPAEERARGAAAVPKFTGIKSDGTGAGDAAAGGAGGTNSGPG